MTTETIRHTGKTEGQKAKPFVRHLPTAGRILLGLIFLAAGAFGLLMLTGILPPPSAPMPAGAAAFNAALAKTGYMFWLTSGTDIIAGILLLSNRFVPLALALLAPLIVNIFAFHVFLAPSGIGPAIVVTALEIYLAWAYRKAFKPMLSLRVVPEATGHI